MRMSETSINFNKEDIMKSFKVVSVLVVGVLLSILIGFSQLGVSGRSQPSS